MASKAKKTTTKKTKTAKRTPREGNKTQEVVAMMKRPAA
jgi:hypothetical protein